MLGLPGWPVREVQQHGGQYQQCQQRARHDGQGLVALLEGDADLQTSSTEQADMPGRHCGRRPGVDAHVAQFVDRAQHGHPITGDERVVSTGALGHGRSVHRHDGDRRQVAEVSPERAVCVVGRLHFELDHGEVNPAELNVVCSASQACLDEGGAGQRGDVEHAAGSRDPAERPGHGRVGQLDDECHLGSQLAHAQRGLERVDLVHLDAHDCRRALEARFGETLASIGVPTDVLHAPVLERPREAWIGIVVDDHHAGPAQVELLHRAQAHTLEAADNHVSRVGVPFHWGHVANPIMPKGCRSVN